MPSSIPVRFAELFFKKFWPSMKEKFIHAIVMFGALVFSYRRGKAAEQVWEIVAPVIWTLCALLIWHAIATWIRLARELARENSAPLVERETELFLGSGKRATVLVRPQITRFP